MTRQTTHSCGFRVLPHVQGSRVLREKGASFISPVLIAAILELCDAIKAYLRLSPLGQRRPRDSKQLECGGI